MLHRQARVEPMVSLQSGRRLRWYCSCGCGANARKIRKLKCRKEETAESGGNGNYGK